MLKNKGLDKTIKDFFFLKQPNIIKPRACKKHPNLDKKQNYNKVPYICRTPKKVEYPPVYMWNLTPNKTPYNQQVQEQSLNHNPESKQKQGHQAASKKTA